MTVGLTMLIRTSARQLDRRGTNDLLERAVRRSRGGTSLMTVPVGGKDRRH
jgi:hypothetical protein